MPRSIGCARAFREFGFKIPVLARSDGEVVDGHLRLKAARKLGSWPGGDTSTIPVILCDEWSPAQVKAFLCVAKLASLPEIRLPSGRCSSSRRRYPHVPRLTSPLRFCLSGVDPS